MTADTTGNEVDLVLDRADKIIPVEIKAGKTVSSDFFKGLTKYQGISGVSSENSYLVYSGDDSVKRKHAHVLSWKDVELLSE